MGDGDGGRQLGALRFGVSRELALSGSAQALEMCFCSPSSWNCLSHRLTPWEGVGSLWGVFLEIPDLCQFSPLTPEGAWVNHDEGFIPKMTSTKARDALRLLHRHPKASLPWTLQEGCISGSYPDRAPPPVITNPSLISRIHSPCSGRSFPPSSRR